MDIESVNRSFDEIKLWGRIGMNMLRRLSIAAILSLATTALVGPPAWSSTSQVNCSISGSFTITDTTTNNVVSSVVTSGQSCTGTAIIPNGVTLIGAGAFGNASSLTSITIPNSVTSIGDYAFYNASSLTSITIPNSVTSIGEGAFAFATALSSITIPNSVTSTGDYTFYNASSLSSISIPNSVTSIGEGAFAYATALSSITIPNSVTSIGGYAFLDASSLTTLNFEGNAPATVGPSAFGSIGPNPIANITSAADFPDVEFWNGLRLVRAAAASRTAVPRGVGGGQISDVSSSPVANPNLGQILDASSSPIADSEPAPPAPYTGPLPSNYSNTTASIGEEVTITGRRLNLVDTCTIDGIDVQISNQSADSFTILIPVGLEPGLKDLVMTGPAGKLTALGALTIQQPKAEITNEALVSTKVNAGSFNGYVAVYAKGHKGKILSWKIGNKWFKTTITSNYQVFQRKIGAGQDLLVDIYVDSQQSMTKVVASR